MVVKALPQVASEGVPGGRKSDDLEFANVAQTTEFALGKGAAVRRILSVLCLRDGRSELGFKLESSSGTPALAATMPSQQAKFMA